MYDWSKVDRHRCRHRRRCHHHRYRYHRYHRRHYRCHQVLARHSFQGHCPQTVLIALWLASTTKRISQLRTGAVFMTVALTNRRGNRLCCTLRTGGHSCDSAACPWPAECAAAGVMVAECAMVQRAASFAAAAAHQQAGQCRHAHGTAADHFGPVAPSRGPVSRLGLPHADASDPSDAVDPACGVECGRAPPASADHPVVRQSAKPLVTVSASAGAPPREWLRPRLQQMSHRRGTGRCCSLAPYSRLA